VVPYQNETYGPNRRPCTVQATHSASRGRYQLSYLCDPRLFALGHASFCDLEGDGRVEPGGAVRSRTMGEARDGYTRHGFDDPLRRRADYAQSFVESLGASRTPVVGHLALARAALESAVIAWWLNDPEVGIVDRAKRGLCEQLYSAQELKKLKIPSDKSSERIGHWKGIATDLGWSVRQVNGKPLVGDESRPSIPGSLDTLLVGSGDWSIGRVQWGYLSSALHVTWYGLRESFVGEPEAQLMSGELRVGFGTSVGSVLAQGVCISRVLRKATQARFDLMGWDPAEWTVAYRDAEQLEEEIIRIARPRTAS
jgi:hypothetical protein